MRNNIPSPNPAIRAILLSSQIQTLMRERGEAAQAIYRSIVAKRTGRLAGSARVEVQIGGRRNDRWTARLIVDAPYAASHEYGTTGGSQLSAAHDLNRVLNQLGHL